MITRISQSPKFVFFLSLALALFGIVSFIGAKKEVSPDVSSPTVRVRASLPGASPGDVERLITKPLERELRTIPRVEEIKSWSFEGSMVIRLELPPQADLNSILPLIEDAVDTASNDLPDKATRPLIDEDNPSQDPIMRIGVTGNDNFSQTLHAARKLKERVEQIPGILSVDLYGDIEETIDVQIPMATLDHLNLSPADIGQRIKDYQQQTPVGRFYEEGNKLQVSVKSSISSLTDLKGIPIASGETQLLLGDIASINRGARERETSSFINGTESLTIAIHREAGASIQSISTSIREILNKLSLHDVTNYLVLEDSADDISSMVNDLLSSIAITILSVIAVISLALTLGTAISVALTIPLSYCISFVLLFLTSSSVNSVVLFSLVLSTGMIVDCAIVIAEEAHRLKGSAVHRHVEAAKRMSSPLIASTVTTLIAFAPMLFWPGSVGAYLKHLPITLISTLTASLVVSLCILPSLTNLTKTRISNNRARTLPWRRFFVFIARHRCKVLGGIGIALLALGAFMIKLPPGTEFLPNEESRYINIRAYQAAPQDLSDMERVLKTIHARVADLPEIEVSTISVRESSFSDMIGSVSIVLVGDPSRRKSSEIARDIRKRIGEIAGATYTVNSVSRGPQSESSIVLELSSEDPGLLHRVVNDIASYSDQPGSLITDVSTDRKTQRPRWIITLKPKEAMMLGVEQRHLGAMVNAATDGYLADSVMLAQENDLLDIRIRLPEEDRANLQMKEVQIPTDDGAWPLSAVANIDVEKSISVIRRTDLARTARVEAKLAQDADLERATAAIDEIIAAGNSKYSGSLSYRYHGDVEEISETNTFMLFAAVVAISLMIGIILFLTNSIRQTLIIFLAPAFSVVGVLITTLVSGQAYGIVLSSLAILSLSGISLNHSIILIDQYNNLLDKGLAPYRAAIASATTRVRPIAMTVMTTVTGLLPMCLGITVNPRTLSITLNNPTMIMWQKLSINMVGGLCISAVLCMIIIPILLPYTRKTPVAEIYLGK